ncbi:hypothetical protein EVAR_94412_1 [Eumeta japonica]|uniref:Uncharacterized protein n=1 Tax=Eumeta variegata TaxID=151549 RepID=A0A4C1TQ23_EUMVA|nr:hypothetical protein EVAR_94412_1 [Eumeta japonica]
MLGHWVITNWKLVRTWHFPTQNAPDRATAAALAQTAPVSVRLWSYTVEIVIVENFLETFHWIMYKLAPSVDVDLVRPKAYYRPYENARGNSDVTVTTKINFTERAETPAKVQSNKKKRQSESESVAPERMRVVYLLQTSASVSNE